MPVGFAGGQYAPYGYVNNQATYWLDPSGLCAEFCTCIVEDVSLVGEGVRQIGVRKGRIPIYGTEFNVTIKLRYEPSDENKPCRLCWMENSSYITQPNPYNLKKDEWVNTYPFYDPAPEGLTPEQLERYRKEGLGPFFFQNDKHVRGEQECKPGGTPVTIELVDRPSLEGLGERTGLGGIPLGLVELTIQRRLSFFINVESGNVEGPSKSVTAQQYIDIIGYSGILVARLG